jgi:peptide/nickel transport system ATP-binding protein
MDRWIREGYRSLARRIGVIYQNPAEAVSHRLSVMDIVAEPLRIQGKAKDEGGIRDRVKRVLAEVHLSTEPEFLNRYPYELNMGAIQRVCIARALILDPSLLVADEPTSSLDPSVQAKVLKMLLDIQMEKGLTMLFVTHDIGLARKIADRIGVMVAGSIVEIGPVASVLARPLHPYTNCLIRCAQGRDERLPSGGNSQEGNSCPYAMQCDRSGELCRNQAPPLVRLESRHHWAWCHFPISEKALT